MLLLFCKADTGRGGSIDRGLLQQQHDFILVAFYFRVRQVQIKSSKIKDSRFQQKYHSSEVEQWTTKGRSVCYKVQVSVWKCSNMVLSHTSEKRLSFRIKHDCLFRFVTVFLHLDDTFCSSAWHGCRQNKIKQGMKKYRLSI